MLYGNMVYDCLGLYHAVTDFSVVISTHINADIYNNETTNEFV